MFFVYNKLKHKYTKQDVGTITPSIGHCVGTTCINDMYTL